MPRPPSTAIHVAKLDVERIRATEHSRVITALAGLGVSETILREAGTMVREAEKTYRGLLPQRDGLMLSLAFYARVPHLHEVSDLTRKTFNARCRAALGLREDEKIPSGIEARAAAARAARIEEIPQDQAIPGLLQVVEEIVVADERKKAALVIRRDASLTLHNFYEWDNAAIAAAARIAVTRVPGDLEKARARLQAIHPEG